MSALKWTIQQTCPHCSGSGLIDSTLQTPEPGDPETQIIQITCPTCNGELVVDWGYINVSEDVAGLAEKLNDMDDKLNDTDDKLNDILDKLVDIKELLDDM